MIGINNKPYVNLDSLIDTSILDLEEIEVGISAAPGRIINYFGMGTDPKYNDLAKYLHVKPEGLSQREEYLWQLQNERPNFWRTYAKIKYGAYSASYVIPLTMMRPKMGFDRYTSIDDENAFEVISEHMKLFPSVKALLDTGFMSVIGRVTFFLQEHDCAIPVHSDNPTLAFDAINQQSAVNEFVWISPRQYKNFFILDEETNEKHVITSKTAWFNSFDKHGGDPTNRMTWSLRIDGKFSPELRKQIYDRD